MYLNLCSKQCPGKYIQSTNHSKMILEINGWKCNLSKPHSSALILEVNVWNWLQKNTKWLFQCVVVLYLLISIVHKTLWLCRHRVQCATAHHGLTWHMICLCKWPLEKKPLPWKCALPFLWTRDLGTLPYMPIEVRSSAGLLKVKW